MTRRIFGALLATALIASPAAAQSDSLPHAGYPAATDTSGWVTSRYDAKYDKTVLELKRLTLDSTLSLTALVALDGAPVRKEAPGVTLSVWSTAPRGTLAADPSLALELDGRRVALRKLWVPPDPIRAPYTEGGLGGMDLNHWLALASAREAAIIVGARRFVLPADYMAGVREFTARMKPVAAR